MRQLKDAVLVAKKHGITPKIVWQWKAVVNARPKKQAELEFKKLKREKAVPPKQRDSGCEFPINGVTAQLAQ